MTSDLKNPTPFKSKVHTVIFGADTPAGKAFDVVLILCIVLSVLAVMVHSVPALGLKYGRMLDIIEWIFTVLFTVEYILRIYSVGRPWRYILSFFGLIDLLAILPTYLNLFMPGTRYLLVIRVLRVLRVFRVLKLVPYLNEADYLMRALSASRRKITVFLFTVVTMVVILGSLMYVVEGEKNGFTSIPLSVYWSIVTLTTVGYGDISPQTPVGQTLAAVIMILGYGIIAVPTGIVTAEMARSQPNPQNVPSRTCPDCNTEGHHQLALYCRQCGKSL